MNIKMEEVRDRVYEWVLELISDGKVLQGLILMLATWNFAYFRYHIRNFRLDDFEKAIKECEIYYFKDKNFKDINFDDQEINERITKVYKTLSAFEGVRYVGASKVMHFLCPKTFVMWDGKIIKHYKAKTSAEGYINFLKKMQEMYKNNEFKNLDENVTIARAIDIYNMGEYSMPEVFKNKK